MFLLSATERIGHALVSNVLRAALMAVLGTSVSCCHSPRSVSPRGLRLVDAVRAAEALVRVNGYTSEPGDPDAADPDTMMFRDAATPAREELAKVMPLRLNTAEGRAFAVRWLPEGHEFDAAVLFRFCKEHVAHYDSTGQMLRGAALSVLVSSGGRIALSLHRDYNAVGADWVLSEGSATEYPECR